MAAGQQRGTLWRQAGAGRGALAGGGRKPLAGGLGKLAACHLPHAGQGECGSLPGTLRGGGQGEARAGAGLRSLKPHLHWGLVSWLAGMSELLWQHLFLAMGRAISENSKL